MDIIVSILVFDDERQALFMEALMVVLPTGYIDLA